MPEPADLRSKNGVLEIELAYRSSTEANGQTRYCYVSKDGSQAPTLRLKPGDWLILKLKNELPTREKSGRSYFEAAALGGNLPAVSYLKANRAQDGHPGNSSPLDEQEFLVNTINFLETLPEWNSTAVVITWDDSDGWFDHVMGPIVNQSDSVLDGLTSTNTCGSGVSSLAGIQSRCGYGPRIPFLVISPFAKSNFVSHTVIDQSSVVRFIEDNWQLPRIGNGSFDVIAGSIENMFEFKREPSPPVFLDPLTGQVVAVGMQQH